MNNTVIYSTEASSLAWRIVASTAAARPKKSVRFIQQAIQKPLIHFPQCLGQVNNTTVSQRYVHRTHYIPFYELFSFASFPASELRHLNKSLGTTIGYTLRATVSQARLPRATAIITPSDAINAADTRLYFETSDIILPDRSNAKSPVRALS